MPRNNSEAEDTEDAKPGLTCKVCGHADFLFVEPYVNWYSTKIVDGVIQVHANTADGQPDDSRDSFLECESCGRSTPIPSKMEWEWS